MKRKSKLNVSFGKSGVHAPVATIHAVIYCRVSSERQKNEGHGLDAQEQRCRAFADGKGYVIDAVFSESFSGGGDYRERPELAKLIAHLDTYPHRQYIVIFDDLKRFARDTQNHIALRQVFRARSAKLESPNFTFDDSPEGAFIETIHAAHNQLEREQNKRQVIQKMKARLESGYWTFGTKKGYDMIAEKGVGTNKNKIAVPNDTGWLLRDVYNDIAAGKYVHKIDVCRYLVERGFGRSSRRINISISLCYFCQILFTVVT